MIATDCSHLRSVVGGPVDLLRSVRWCQCKARGRVRREQEGRRKLSCRGNDAGFAPNRIGLHPGLSV
jgi:hypothetical protein